jgi:hypothetical protein
VQRTLEHVRDDCAGELPLARKARAGREGALRRRRATSSHVAVAPREGLPSALTIAPPEHDGEGLPWVALRARALARPSVRRPSCVLF